MKFRIQLVNTVRKHLCLMPLLAQMLTTQLLSELPILKQELLWRKNIKKHRLRICSAFLSALLRGWGVLAMLKQCTQTWESTQERFQGCLLLLEDGNLSKWPIHGPNPLPACIAQFSDSVNLVLWYENLLFSVQSPGTLEFPSQAATQRKLLRLWIELVEVLLNDPKKVPLNQGTGNWREHQWSWGDVLPNMAILSRTQSQNTRHIKAHEIHGSALFFGAFFCSSTSAKVFWKGAEKNSRKSCRWVVVVPCPQCPTFITGMDEPTHVALWETLFVTRV